MSFAFCYVYITDAGQIRIGQTSLMAVLKKVFNYFAFTNKIRYIRQMEKYYMQQTLIDDVSFSGIGVHSGKETKIIVRPAPENHGIRFRRTDIPGTPDI